LRYFEPAGNPGGLFDFKGTYMTILVEHGKDISGAHNQRPSGVEPGQRFFDNTLKRILHSDGSNWQTFPGYNDRVELLWVAGKRGKPGLNADIQNAAEATRMIADPDFELLGTNATSASSAFNAEGGVKFSTAGADNDQVIVLPHLDANQSAWTQWTWGTDKQTIWETRIATDASIAAAILWFGLKLTNTPTIATDNDQAFFRYQNGVNSGKFEAVYSINGTDTTVDTGITVAVSTKYHLVIAIDSSRIATFYINGTLVATSTALKDATDLIPYLGAQASGAAAAKAFTGYMQSISRQAA
jgi:hypothetical protein